MKFRLYPTPAQERELERHCADARYVWNLALEQLNYYRPQWGPTPGFRERSRQLTEARAASPWLASGSREVQEKALRDFDEAVCNWWRGIHRRPKWRKKGQHEGFRNAANFTIHRLSRRAGEVTVPNAGRIRFRWTRQPGKPKSYRVTRDQAGRWWVAFAVMPTALERTPTGAMVGLDRGIANTIATSDGALHRCPTSSVELARVRRLQRRMARQVKGSKRRDRTRVAIARLRARDADRAKDWVEKLTTQLVLDHDLIAIEDLNVVGMTRSAKGSLEQPGTNVKAKAGLNRSILANRWGLFARRLIEKADLAGVQVVKVNPRHTSQRCTACGHVAPENRKNQANFRCVACGHEAHADVGAALNILAAGQAVAARGGLPLGGLVKREPHSEPSAA